MLGSYLVQDLELSSSAPRNSSLAKRAVRDDRYTFLLTMRQDVLLDRTINQAILDLVGNNLLPRQCRLSLSHLVHGKVAYTNMPRHPIPYKLLHRPHSLPYRDPRIRPVQLVQVHSLYTQPVEAHSSRSENVVI